MRRRKKRTQFVPYFIPLDHMSCRICRSRSARLRVLRRLARQLALCYSLQVIYGAAVPSSCAILSAQVVERITVWPDRVTIAPGATEQLTATVQDPNGDVLTARSVAWTSSDTSIARVTSFGLVTAVGPGAAIITATSEGGTAAAIITIPPALDSPRLPPVGGTVAPGDLAHEVFINSEAERYLRVLQSTNAVPSYPWSIRSFSPIEVRRLLPADSSHPWHARLAPAEDAQQLLRFSWIRPQVDLFYNSAFPYGTNDGAVWAGRGLTTALQGGFALGVGVFSLTVAPTVYRAENTPFVLGDNGLPQRPFADRQFGAFIDLPQRFGPDAYMRVDPGQSTLRVDARAITAGISTANQQWGPAIEYPLLLGNNAPGFLHAFIGTSRALDVRVGKVHARLVSGVAAQSAYSPMPPDSAYRQVSGLVILFSPRGLPGLELGGARFFHSPWSGIGQESIARPFEHLFFEGNQHTADNQLASAFIRWVFPASGFEFYGEYLRDDYFYDVRDLVVGPDRHSAYLAGFQRTWRRAAGSILSLRGEVLNSRVSPEAPLGRISPLYIHSRLRQGHTHEGQTLGSPAVYGGAGAVLALDSYYKGGRRTLFWRRTLEDNRYVSTSNDAESLDAMHSLGGELLLARPSWDITAGATGVYNLNRYGGSDAINVNVHLGVRMKM